MTKSPNPWLDLLNLNDDELTRLAAMGLDTEIRIEAQADGHKAAKLIEITLMKIFVPTGSFRRFARTSLEVSASYIKHHYPSISDYLLRLNSRHLLVEPWGVQAVLGLAGTGKSAACRALQRIVGQTNIQIPAHGVHSVMPVRRIEMGEKWGTVELHRQLGMSSKQGDGTKWLYQTGCSRTVMDETQFIAQSAGSHVRICTAVFKVASYGPPLYAVMNFSLGHKLKKANHEVRSRMLGNPYIMVPDPPESDDWKMVVMGMTGCLRRYIEFDVTRNVHDLWNLTAGIKRNLARLLAYAYLVAHGHGRRNILWSDVDDAYGSAMYCDSRSDVCALISSSIAGDKPTRRDLACPIESSEELQYRDKLRSCFDRKISISVERESLSVEQRSILRKLSGHRKRSSPSTGKVKADRSLEGLLAASKNFK